MAVRISDGCFEHSWANNFNLYALKKSDFRTNIYMV